ncbi:MAG: Fe-S cluster assembly protein IscX [Anaerolineae bacterium]|nr:Fe-S cluster assembly protein IscX [Anaerolineae bacterium]
MDWSHRLHWDATYEVALALIAAHPDTNVEQVSLETIYRWVLELPEFDDDPALGSEAILLSILQEWYEEVSA